MSNEILDPPGKSIFKHNLNLILRNSNSLVTSFLKVSCPGIWLPRVLKSLEYIAKDWLMEVSTATSRVVMLHVQISSSSSKSIADMVDNANKLGRSVDEMCTCDRARFDHFQKLQGHVFQPLLALVNRTGLTLPSTWNAKARCVPPTSALVSSISSSLADLSFRRRTSLSFPGVLMCLLVLLKYGLPLPLLPPLSPRFVNGLRLICVVCLRLSSPSVSITPSA